MKLRAQTRCSYKKNELITNERTFVMPGGSETYTFEMRWAYDSWNRPSAPLRNRIKSIA
ncbi:MAG TPA: hypothetical protein P5228_10110 [Bacteroidales bacterium]|nr:hypothetical protein [Bacteroidales bacterium]